MSQFTRNFRYWIPAFVWLGIIALESFRLSSNVTGVWLWHVIHALHIPISEDHFARLHHILRKAGHVTGYGILCLLMFRAWYHTVSHSSSRRWRLRCALLSLSTTLLTAMLDEFHQSFDPTRTASIRDIGLDITGGITFLLFALFILKLWRTEPARDLETVSA